MSTAVHLAGPAFVPELLQPRTTPASRGARVGPSPVAAAAARPVPAAEDRLRVPVPDAAARAGSARGGLAGPAAGAPGTGTARRPDRLPAAVARIPRHAGGVRALGAVRAMNRRFGGTGVTGAERAADCMALLQGATWTSYTSCSDRGWRAAAAVLLQGRRL